MMFRYISILLVGLAALSAVGAARAENIALIVANGFHNNQPNFRNAHNVLALQSDLRNAGFTIEVLRNTRTNVSSEQSAALWRRLSGADKLVVVLGGHFVHALGQSWMLHTDAGRPDALTIGQHALPVQAFYQIAAQRPGEAIIAIADESADTRSGAGVGKGFVPGSIPQGVTVVHGAPSQVRSFLVNEMRRPGQPMAAAARRGPEGLLVTGFLPRNSAFIPRPDPDRSGAADRALWQQVQARDTLEGYEQYLQRFPGGIFAQEARRRADALRLTPQDRARIAEETLGLSRDQRRAIQRQLTLLGFDTRGVDGLLGRNSRNAIARWQTSASVPATGYLTANQVTRLHAAAAIRAEELRAEAEQRRLEEERKDRDFWYQTGAGATEDGLRTYLRRYPDGIYAGQAKGRLKEIEREKRRLAKVAEREAWDRAVTTGTLASYQQYLQDYPEGRFVDEALARVEQLKHPETPPEVIAAARAEEAQINLNGLTRNLIEARLRKLSFEPGRVDGRFTDKTRRALRRYQRANDLPVTGFVTRATIVRLLAGAIEN